MTLLVSAALAGCVDRKMTITSQPEGALVFVSDKEVGRTPLTMPFTWYGDYDIILRLEDYETLKTHANINAPIYEIPPFDLLSHLAPWTYHDHRYLHYKLDKRIPSSDKVLIRRADELREKNLESVER
ncbi:MAG: PEGA domain-containing protein [Phycisphaerae bacterium]|nr:PEGA domain-containing protein [Phycisphaerae bacterium]